MLSRIERYKVAKTKPHTYSFLSPNLKEELKPNFGLVIYQEDIIRILKEYTNWSYDKCNQFRLNLKNKCVDASDLEEFKKSSPTEVFDLILEEIPWAYFEEIEKWENLHGFSWSDIGIKLKGVSLLQN
jgi:hypothetical protein